MRPEETMATQEPEDAQGHRPDSDFLSRFGTRPEEDADVVGTAFPGLRREDEPQEEAPPDDAARPNRLARWGAVAFIWFVALSLIAWALARGGVG